ncbi:ABC transporter substrate-binding protein [Desulfatiferula olefinivorans]
MKKTLSLFVLMLFVCIVSNGSAEETWKITSLDWQPYSGADMATQGNSVQKLRELLKKEGINLIVEFYPWKRAQDKAKDPEYVGYFPAWPEEVAEGFFASVPVDQSSIDVMKKIGTTLVFTTIDELFEKHDVGYIDNYVYPESITRAIAAYAHHARPATNEASLAKMLSKGRFQAALTDSNVMLYTAQKEGISNIESFGDSLMRKELVIAFRNGDDNVKRAELLKRLLNQP